MIRFGKDDRHPCIDLPHKLVRLSKARCFPFPSLSGGACILVLRRRYYPMPDSDESFRITVGEFSDELLNDIWRTTYDYTVPLILNPGLVAARDKAVTELRREKVNRELAQKPALQQHGLGADKRHEQCRLTMRITKYRPVCDCPLPRLEIIRRLLQHYRP